ncbi:MAG: RNA pyrophosphohydrolase [Sphingopyxis sp.]
MTTATLPYRPGVGAMIVNSAGHVFVGQRIDSRLDAWQMPQGGVDPGEDAQTALFREVKEETGIAPHHIKIIAQGAAPFDYDLPPELVSTVWKGRFRGQRQHWFLLQFTGTDGDVNIATEHAEFAVWKWVPHTALVDLIVPFKRDLYAAIVAEFAPHIAQPAAGG